MGLPRSAFYAAPRDKPSDSEIIAKTRAINDVFGCYGYRRVGAELRHRGRVVNAKKVRWLVRGGGTILSSMKSHASTTWDRGAGLVIAKRVLELQSL